MTKVFTEICKLSSKDCFHIAERHKSKFDYPLHRHEEYELNFIEHGAGVMRIVGDSMEEIGEYELVLIGDKNLEHVWEQGRCTSKDIREITIQFSPSLFEGELLSKNQFASIRKMLDNASHGIVFPLETIMKVYFVLCKIPCPLVKFLIGNICSSYRYSGVILSSENAFFIYFINYLFGN